MHITDQIAAGGIVSIRDSLIKLQSEGKEVLRLESGDPSFPPAPHIREAQEKAFRDGFTHYTQGAGIPPLRKALVTKLTVENHIPVSGFENVLITNGAMHGLYIAFQALIENLDDEVIVPNPTWTETVDNILLSRGHPVRYSLDQHPDEIVEDIRSLITPRTKGIVINSPHNPTGMVMGRETLQGILNIAIEHNLKIISDEAYEHVIYDGKEHVSIGSLPGADKHVVSIFSMSKSYAMSGLRVGYLCNNDRDYIERLSKLSRCTINGVNSVSQYGALAAITGSQVCVETYREIYQKRRDILMKGLTACRLLEPHKPDGAFYIWSKIIDPKHNCWEMSNLLVKDFGIGSAPGEVFGPSSSDHIRFAFSCSTEQIEKAAELLGNM